MTGTWGTGWVRRRSESRPHSRRDRAIESQEIIEVEKIAAFFSKFAGKKRVFQEELTRRAAVTLGAKVRSEGWHSGIRVVSEAP